MRNYADEVKKGKESGRNDTRDVNEEDKEPDGRETKENNENSCKSQDHTEKPQDEAQNPASTNQEGKGKHASDASGHGGGVNAC